MFGSYTVIFETMLLYALEFILHFVFYSFRKISLGFYFWQYILHTEKLYADACSCSDFTFRRLHCWLDIYVDNFTFKSIFYLS